MLGGPAAEGTGAVLKHRAILIKNLCLSVFGVFIFLSVVGYLVTGGRGNKKKTWQ